MSSFFFHYNKPASTKAGKPQATIHYQDKCLIVDDIVCNVPIKSVSRKRQPRWVMSGKANSIKIKNRIATIS